jgi:hypothetical protein
MFMGFFIPRSTNELLLVTCGCATVNGGIHQCKIVVETLPNKKNYGCG